MREEPGARIQEPGGALHESSSSSDSIWVFEPANVRTTNTYTEALGIHTSTHHAKTFEDEYYSESVASPGSFLLTPQEAIPANDPTPSPKLCQPDAKRR